MHVWGLRGVIGNVVGDRICMYLIDVEGVVFVS
jgi:hypothetical protein